MLQFDWLKIFELDCRKKKYLQIVQKESSVFLKKLMSKSQKVIEK
jgi:hypothetical protein